jgi:2'-5' RNA ligase
LFVAVNFSDQNKDEIGEIIDELRGLSADAKWVTRKNLHLTLQFLGNTPEAQVPELITALEAAGQGIAPFAIDFAGFGVFPNPNRPRVLWLGLTGQVAVLAKLQSQVQTQLALIGLESEKRRFLPHLTLARIRTNSNLQLTLSRAAVLMPPNLVIASEQIKAFTLVASELTPRGPIYTTIARIILR